MSDERRPPAFIGMGAYTFDPAEPLETIRLTIDLTREADTPNQWTAACVEMDVISAGKTPEVALEAVAEAVRMVTRWCVEHAGDETARDAMTRIIEEVAERRDRIAEGLARIEQISTAHNPKEP